MRFSDPYRFYFPVGWLLGFLGVGIWIPWFSMQWGSYPGAVHPDLMVGGFLMLYAVGFLSTAIPRFTGTSTMTDREEKVSFALVALLLMSYLFPDRRFTLVADLLILVNLSVFAIPRFIRRTAQPPTSFLFVGVGLLSGISGLLLLIFSKNPMWIHLGKSLYQVAFMASLVLGVGSRLVPGLLGHQELPQPQSPSPGIKKLPALSKSPRFHELAAVAIFFWASFPIEAFYSVALGDLLRAGVISFMLIRHWKIYRLPQKTGVLSWGLWLSSLVIATSPWLVLLMPPYRLHWLHLFFISGLGMMTVMISTRVTLVHGQQQTTLEKNSIMLLLTGLLIMAASAFRVEAGLSVEKYRIYLLAAGFCWCAGLAIWAARFARFWKRTSP